MRIALAFVAAALLVSSAATAAPEITIGVLPLKGRAPKPFRVDATDILEQSITGLPDVRVVSFDNVADILGQNLAGKGKTGGSKAEPVPVFDTHMPRLHSMGAGARAGHRLVAKESSRNGYTAPVS